MSSVGVFRAHIALVGCNIVWACDYPLYNLLLGRYISPMAMVCASLVVAAALSWLPRLWERGERIERSDWALIAIAALMMGVVRKGMMMFGLSRTSPIDGSIIATLVPLLVLIVSVVSGEERFTARKGVGLIFGLTGALAVVLTSSNADHTHSELWGNVMMVCSGVVTALYMVFFKRLVAKYRVTTLLRAIYTISAVVMLPVGWHSVVTVDLTALEGHHLWLAAAFVLIVPTYLPNLLLNYSLRYVQPTVTSIYTYIQPILAVVLSVAMGLDRLHLDTLLFALMIFTGVWLVIGSNAEQHTG
ncbi:MAG: EamA family transporter [Alistipes sp.]|nr:EamA family transporter [Alistipes sp.]